MSKTYAHLLSSVAAVKAKEVDGDKDADRMEDEKPPANDKEDGKKAKKAKRAKAKDEGEEDEERDEHDSDEGESEEEREDREEDEEEKREDKEDKKGKKSKKASADMNGAVSKAAQLEERLRCARIFRSKAAGGRIEAACQFAFHTDLSADSAIAILETLPKQDTSAAAKRTSIDDRMARMPSASVGSDIVAQAPSQAQHFSEEQIAKMSSEQKALMIVNASRAGRGEAPLTKLPN